MRNKLLLLFGLICSTQAMAEDITTYSPAEDEGIVYFLPKTAIEVSLIVTRTDYKPGEFYQYANRYLRLNDVKGKANSLWTLKAIETRPVGVIDSTKAYIVKLKDRDPLSNIQLTEDGIIRSINTEPAAEPAKPARILSHAEQHENGKKYLTEEILLAGSTAKMAELTAKEIYNIRESKNLIMRGQVDAMPKDGASLEIVLNGLNKQEKALTALFTGTTDQEDIVVSTLIEPEENMDHKIAFRFSEKLGILSTDDLSGEPIYISIKSLSPQPKQPQIEDKKGKKDKLGGVIYNIPGKGRTTITYKGKDLIDQEYPITQFGNTETLTYKLFNKKGNIKVVFDVTTGAITKINTDE